jgi:glucose-6-phosphate isomerase
MTVATGSILSGEVEVDMSAAVWERFKKYYCRVDSIGLGLDISRMNFSEGFLSDMSGSMERAFAEMADLEAGGVANADEQRMVGHYWLRAPSLSPSAAIRSAIEGTLSDVKSFAAAIHAGKIAPSGGGRFKRILSIGIGGSALGPQFVTEALGDASDKMVAHFVDNTDPDGIDRVLAQIGDELGHTLTLIISKSGGTKETRNGMLEAKLAYDRAGLSFESCAVAITGEGSALDQLARRDGWLKRFPMWDWVGGRTSEMSTVGLVPAALQGYDIDGMLTGAADCDAATRVADVLGNPAALLALMWYQAGSGRGEKAMVVLPYKDRLGLFSKYLQQLVMESVGKRLDREGNVVHQGITVYGNKGSTDQHAYVQQLRDGLNNFFAVFVEVLKDRDGRSIEVEDGVTSGDFLGGFLQGTRSALYEADRESVTITIEEVTARTLGALIALFERAVGFYASLINVNAYHQPGVEAGKKAAEDVIALQRRLLSAMAQRSGQSMSAEAWASALGEAERAESVFMLLRRLSANSGRGIVCEKGDSIADDRFRFD